MLVLQIVSQEFKVAQEAVQTPLLNMVERIVLLLDIALSHETAASTNVQVVLLFILYRIVVI